jgi:serum/glucocorticoid-regulated kinase 2
MYVRVLQDELQFPEDRTMDQDTKSLLRGVRVALSLCLRVGGVSWHSRLFFVVLQLLQRNPSLRMSEPRIKKHPYFSMMCVSFVVGPLTDSLTYCTETGPMSTTNAIYVSALRPPRRN